MEYSEPATQKNVETQTNSTPRSWLTAEGGPKPVSQLEMVFGGGGDLIGGYLPRWKEIPDEFKRGHTHWNNLASKWFFSGADKNHFQPKAGIDQATALRHIGTCLGSFAPKHEHKEAGCAYLMSLFFVEPPSVQEGDEKA